MSTTEGTEPEEQSPNATRLYKSHRIEHPDEFIRQLTGITAPWVSAWGTVRPWYRGIPKVSFSLEPSLFRYRPRSFLLTESNFLNQFYSAGARFLDHHTNDRLEMLTIMQHHGVPTRLLDWTENAFAALYFAVRQPEHFNDAEDAVVWVLEPLRLNEIMRGERTIPFSGAHLMGPRLPVPMYPVHGSSRVGPQRSAFTIHPFSPQHALVKLALAEVDAGRPSFLHALQVKGSARSFIRNALTEAFGQGEFTFFPDLDGLARELRMRERMEGRG